MKVSYSWLKDYVDIKIDPKKLAYMLTMAGINVASCEKVGDDYMLEFEITANRADCLSIIGIAREVAALLGKKLKIPKELTDYRLSTIDHRPKSHLNIIIEDKELCPRYTGRVVRDVEVGPSPDWLKKKIIAVGLRPINNIVDITNFVLCETGQPMHAFDLDKIKGDIFIRCAREGEKIITIDNTARTCSSGMLVIADESGPIAIAGIMGGSETEVGNMTKNILLESAFFDPISIRRTSRALGLGSESSYRFERRVDNNMVLRASERASTLISAIAKGRKEGLIDVGTKKSYSKDIKFDIEKASLILGTSIGKKEATKILKALGFSVKDGRKTLKVTVPSFREDVRGQIDLTEEIARIHGYENIPLTIPDVVGNTAIKDFLSHLEDRLRSILTSFGLDEIITYSLINRKSITDLGIPEDEIVTIKNPLSIDQEIMRPTSLVGMLKTISYNINRKTRRLSFFEIGNVYKEKENSYIEEPVLSIGLSGIKREDWKIKEEEFSFFDLKGILEKVFEEFGIQNAVFKEAKIETLNKNVSSTVECEGKIVASLGEVKRSVLEKFDIAKNVFYGEIYIKNILKKAILYNRYKPPSRYPSITRDISVIADETVASSDVVHIIKEIGRDLVKDISLVDYYKGKQISEGKAGLLYRIEYRSDKKTLEDSEIDKLHSEIKNALSSKLAVSFR